MFLEAVFLKRRTPFQDRGLDPGLRQSREDRRIQLRAPPIYIELDLELTTRECTTLAISPPALPRDHISPLQRVVPL
jgi:hypothetical protein